MDNNNEEVKVPTDAAGNPSFLFPPELVIHLNSMRASIEQSILSIAYDMEMPRKDLAFVVNLQGQLAVVKELLFIHESKLAEAEE